jgi:hypothetical protein
MPAEICVDYYFLLELSHAKNFFHLPKIFFTQQIASYTKNVIPPTKAFHSPKNLIPHN